MAGNHTVIVKAESCTSGERGRDEHMISATFGVLLMAAVTPGIEAVKLSQNELRALWDVAPNHVKPQDTDHGAATKKYITDVLKDGIASHIVFKMPMVPNLLGLEKAMETHKTAEFAQHLAADDYAATVELGKILAVDLFSGNDDRFDETGALVNPGNVLLHKIGEKWHAIGLDHYSSGGGGAGQHSNLSAPVRQGWGGLRLNTPNQLTNYAGKIMTALNKTGTRHNEPGLGLQAKFQEKLTQGLAEGAALIRSTVQHAELSTIPDGVKSRFQTLHWDLHAPRSTTNPVHVVDNIIGGSHAPQPSSTTGGRQSPGTTTTGGRQSPGTSGGRQSPSTTTNNLKKKSN